ncbi:MAG: hypothetical protein DRO10_00100 [Thermoprotei archaeon]|nr:MAG: hypothetical protein DRO10_00100 [Thermoprotei archaeon]
MVRVNLEPLRRHKSLVITCVSLAVLIIALAVGVYLRMYPIFIAERWGYGPTLQELDPYSEYWVAEKLLTKGLGYYLQLTPQNPETHIFWYPWGRDFTRSSLPMVPYFSVITYYIAHAFSPSLTLYTWMVYVPLLFFIMSTLGIYFTARELWGDIPAAISALTGSLMFISRHLAGFTVKYSAGLAFLFPAIYFHVRAWKRDSRVSALLTGIFLALTAASWAGFNILLGIIFLMISLLPLLRKVRKEDFIILALEMIPLTLALVTIPFYGWQYLIKSVGVLIPASFLMLGIGCGLQKLAEKRELVISMPFFKRTRLLYTLILILVGVVGIGGLISGVIHVKGKALAALGLSGVVHVLVSTVQEYAPARPDAFIQFQGAAVVVSLLMLIYFAYRVIMKKDLLDLFVGALYLLSFYATVNLSYFFPYLNYLTALVSGSFIYVMLKKVMAEGVRKDWFISMFSILIVALYVTAVVGQGVTGWAKTYEYQAPMLLTSGISLAVDAPAWQDTLKWLRNDTSDNSVVISWWDYGYWISVLGNRTTVADGATLNATQIELLAKALTGSEEEAYITFTQKFKADPNNLYLVAYEVYMVDERNGYVYVGPLVLGNYYLGADAAKGIAAIYRIANRTPPIYQYQPPQSRIAYSLPDWTNETLQEATLFKIILKTAYVVWGDQGFKAAFPYKNPYRPDILPEPNMTIFQPAQISVSKVLSNPNIYVVVSVYKAVSPGES